MFIMVLVNLSTWEIVINSLFTKTRNKKNIIKFDNNHYKDMKVRTFCNTLIDEVL